MASVLHIYRAQVRAYSDIRGSDRAVRDSMLLQSNAVMVLCVCACVCVCTPAFVWGWEGWEGSRGEKKSAFWNVAWPFKEKSSSPFSPSHTMCTLWILFQLSHYNDPKGLHIRLHNKIFYYIGLGGMQNIFNTAICAYDTKLLCGKQTVL